MATSTIPNLNAVPFIVSIPTGQWSGSGSDYYITVNASNVTSDSILIPHFDKDSESKLNGPVWCVPGSASFTIHTSAIPTNTVEILVEFLCTKGQAQYQVLADVYSKSQTDSAIAQATAAETLFDSPKYLASGTDLDALTTAGVYACESGGVAATLINCPITNNNFSLLVLRSSTGRFKQVIFALDTIYVRYNAANGWNGWNPYYSTATMFGANSATSFDDLTMPGLFGVTISTTGKRPVSNIGSYAAIVLSGGLISTNVAITQIAIPTGSNTPNGVYIRNRNAAGVWSGWYKINASAVS